MLEGSVRRSGTRLRITAQLIRGDDGFHLWSKTYDREISNIFEIQDEIARSVAEQLAVPLGLSSESLVKDRTEDLVAYEHYLRAKQLFLHRSQDYPRWKEQVHHNGIFDLWKARGFPAQCRAKGSDDFECD